MPETPYFKTPDTAKDYLAEMYSVYFLQTQTDFPMERRESVKKIRQQLEEDPLFQQDVINGLVDTMRYRKTVLNELRFKTDVGLRLLANPNNLSGNSAEFSLREGETLDELRQCYARTLRNAIETLGELEQVARVLGLEIEEPQLPPPASPFGPGE
jgi:hypothetical protein